MAKNKHNQPKPGSNKSKRSKRNEKLRGAALPLASLPLALRQHIESLGLGGVEDYLDWCRQEGFVCGIYKTAEQMETEQARSGALPRVRLATMRRPERLVARLLDGELSAVPLDLKPVADALHESRPMQQRLLVRRVLRHVMRVCPDLLFEAALPGEIYLHAVARLGEQAHHAVQEVESWRPRSCNAGRRLASLARHLYARFEVPGFMDGAWFDSEKDGARHRAWFVHVGAGKNIRTATDLPLVLTRKMAHWFAKAPRDYIVCEALRFGQVLGLGGDLRLAEALRGTRLCQEFGHEQFWESVLRFFIRHPMLDRLHVGPIVDYLHNQRYSPRQGIGDNGRVRSEPPPQPNLCMRGRDPETLLGQVLAWHVGLGRAFGGAEFSWLPSGIPAHRAVEGDAASGNQRIWTVRELTSSAELRHEGRTMQHCVASYASSCRVGRTTIWSMEVEQKTGVIKVLTIEVDVRTRSVTQARGRSNARPTELGRRVMAQWAATAGLRMGRWV